MPELLQQIQQTINTPFWHHADFWINGILAAAGLIFAISAYLEARAAKGAAKSAQAAADEAGRFMTMQTVAVELMGISQRLVGVDMGITFREARALLDDINGKLHRLTSPFQNDDALAPHIANIHGALGTIKTALSNAKPNVGVTLATGQIYYAIEGEAGTLNTYVNDLLGQLETKSHRKLAT